MCEKLEAVVEFKTAQAYQIARFERDAACAV
jgi:hypothetical protein